MTQEEPDLHLGTRNHLLMTSDFALHGTVTPCPGRLSDLLRSHSHHAIKVQDAELTPLWGDASETHSQVQVHLQHLLLAHEYVALGGDEHQRIVRRGRHTQGVDILLAGLQSLRVVGLVAPESLEREDRFLAVVMPKVTGTAPYALAAARILQDLPYLLVNRDGIASLILADDEPETPDPAAEGERP